MKHWNHILKPHKPQWATETGKARQGAPALPKTRKRQLPKVNQQAWEYLHIPLSNSWLKVKYGENLSKTRTSGLCPLSGIQYNEHGHDNSLCLGWGRVLVQWCCKIFVARISLWYKAYSTCCRLHLQCLCVRAWVLSWVLLGGGRKLFGSRAGCHWKA